VKSAQGQNPGGAIISFEVSTGEKREGVRGIYAERERRGEERQRERRAGRERSMFIY
jgi:hypothetical protein